MKITQNILTLMTICFVCLSLSSQEYFTIKKAGGNQTKKIWLRSHPYTIITPDTEYTSTRLLSYHDSTLSVFKYRIEGNMGYGDSAVIPLKNIRCIKKLYIANTQIRGAAAALLCLGIVGTIVAGVSGEPEGAAFLFGLTVVAPATVLLVRRRVKTFDMQKEWTFEKGVRGNKTK